jgi:hypothetical protein
MQSIFKVKAAGLLASSNRCALKCFFPFRFNVCIKQFWGTHEIKKSDFDLSIDDW